jgi:hypothetical protein
MVLSATFNNISFILWPSVILVEEKQAFPEKATDLPQVADKLLSHKVVARTPCHELDLNFSGDMHR